MSQPWRLKLRFWGVRGSTPTPRLDCMAHGGNTPCVEIRAPGQTPLIFDLGTGARELGIALTEEFNGQKLSLNVFLSHFHWDHIQGIPFFAPFYDAGNAVTFHSSVSAECLSEFLSGHMAGPYFPVGFDALPVGKNAVDLGGKPAQFGSVAIHPFPMSHPQNSTGYRIEHDGAVIVYATDREPGNAPLDQTIREQSRDADILVHDAQYTPDEYGPHKGWGHSSWMDAVEVAKAARVKQLVLFHHDPGHNDDRLAAILAEAKRHFPNTITAKEGMVLTV